MPANNRVHSSAALQTHGIWQSAIGYDPYAPDQKAEGAGGEDNAYDSFQGLLQLAKLTGSNADQSRGACKKCHRVGHLTFQCRNFLTAKEDVSLPADVAKGLMEGQAQPEEVEESDVSLSDEDDDERERALADAARARGLLPNSIHKKKDAKRTSSKDRMKKKKKSRSPSDSESDSESEEDSDSDDSRERRRRRKKEREDKKRHKKRSKDKKSKRRRDSDDSDSEEDRRRRRKSSSSSREKSSHKRDRI